MPLFSYKAKNSRGKVIEDVVQASNKQEAASIIKSDDLKILTIKNIDRGLNVSIGGKVKVEEKAAFCRFLATMLRAGLPLPEAVDIIREETKNPKMKKVVYDISFKIRKGSSLSSILSQHKDVFDPVFLTMVKAGEESGTLEKSLDYLSKQLTAAHELAQKVKGAMMYPMVIVAAMMANFIVMLVFVLPKVSEVFTQLNVELPTVTAIIMRFGNFVGNNTFLVIGLMVLILIIGLVLYSIKAVRQGVVDLFVRLPVVRNISIQLDIARFAQTLSTLLKSGVPIIAALDVATDIMRHPSFRGRMKQLSEGVAGGESLSDLLTSGKRLFPNTVTQTIKAGEKTGSLEVVLEEMAEFYEKEVDFSLKRFTSLLEPLLMLVIGLAVGAMVVIMITPIYSLVGGIDSQV